MALETTPGKHHQASKTRLSLILPAAALLSIILVSWFSLATKPAEALVATWWPASGIALGAAIRLPKRHLWWFSLACGLVILGTNLAQFHQAPMALAASVGTSLEVWVGATILRWRTDGVPALRSRPDLAKLLIAAFLGATAFDAVLSATALVVSGPAAAAFHLASAGPRRTAGILLITPLFMQLPETPPPRFSPRIAAHMSAGLIVASLVFLTNQHFPLAFLPLVPPIWSALLIPVRWLMAEMIGIAAIASYGSASGHGPFAFINLGAAGGGCHPPSLRSGHGRIRAGAGTDRRARADRSGPPHRQRTAVPAQL
ncbi:MASE1 domain-containing protein [Propionicimonas sp.]|uniref:MASE1 domain-containing protein n=1 Tax=Propionicimonas sp. TaxID=1955623 RepID=UPI0017C586FE|nr:MASE1 domain-containing protein [Propionicimonas sp.]MBU3978020.1 MASE1 domain-containing protein [Actinomycetota bacterium]MBA3021758.1 hypothetical protein [Propionicimonas sp.]MBU3985464.1 MASE1 domain-containing protein [Actinomycetota bacterium]MBU4007559.1 MASE1 domain-containing protein [Actinomycetota bacterium]MBU4066547.1 MASE1 domain-containing protein [Actinomycetota bacterium]